jgi:hypothetical protein
MGRICRVCKVEKDIGCFSVRNKEKGTHRTECKACMNKSRTKQPSFGKWHKENRDKIRKYNRQQGLLRNYGLSTEQYDALMNKQGCACAICGTTDFMGKGKTAHVDHCHETGAVRGLLCNLCNVGLGAFHDSVEKLRNAMKYLAKHDPLISINHVEPLFPWFD